jgi:hypothetical protein
VITAEVPRVKDEKGQTDTVAVPWAEKFCRRRVRSRSSQLCLAGAAGCASCGLAFGQRIFDSASGSEGPGKPDLEVAIEIVLFHDM